MRLNSLTSGLPFRAALWATLIFWVVCGVSGTLLVRAVENTLLDELAAQSKAEAILLSEIYQETGETGLLEALRITAKTIQEPERLAGLLGPSGVSLIGPISTMPDFVGTQRRNVSRMAMGVVSGSYVLHVSRIDEQTLIVGRNDLPVRKARLHLIVGLLIFACVVSLTLLGLGVWASHVSLTRLNAMDTALRHVGAGNIKARLPVFDRKDQFDQVSVRVNENLDHLERVVDGMKTTASALAHDLKTPLSHVQMALHTACTVAERGDNPLPNIEAALLETEELNTIFEAVLRISRIRAATGKNAFALTPLHAIADKTVEFLAPLAEENGQTLTLDATGPSPVFGDEGMIQQAVVNLVKNAIAYAGPEASIAVSVAPDRIEVRDTGPGVPEGTLDRLTDLFVRADTTRASEGSGLGLALVQAVAERHGAALQLKNLYPGFSASFIFKDAPSNENS